jgi:formiminoglutamase
MNLIDFLEPVAMEKPDEHLIWSPNILGKSISIFTPGFSLDELDSYDLAILAIPEDRNSYNKGASLAPEKIRAQLYQLYKIDTAKKIIDLGNLRQGNTFNDTYVALKEVIQILLGKNIVVLLIGGTQELTLPVYQAFEASKLNINLVTIDRTIDIIKDSVKSSSESYLTEILLKKRRLFKYCNLGHQIYLTDTDILDLINKLYHDTYRLGDVRANIPIVEPIFRDADLVSFDISSIRQADAPAFFNPSPNGFYAEEACQLSRYAGLSDMVSVFGIFEVNPKFDNRNQTSNLAAQMIWHFIDGFTCRNLEMPSSENKSFKTFIVGNSDLDYEITFYKSTKSDRWWMEVPNPKTNKPVIISCAYADYLTACEQEVPNIWWKSFQKLS